MKRVENILNHLEPNGVSETTVAEDETFVLPLRKDVDDLSHLLLETIKESGTRYLRHLHKRALSN